MTEMTCIICGTPFTEHSVEHIVPDAIGGNVHIKCVCRDCNNKLGDKVDCQLTEDPMILLARQQLGIRNLDRKTVDLFKAFKFQNENGETVVIKKGDGKQMPRFYDGTIRPEVIVSKDDQGNAHVQLKKGSDFESVIVKAKRELKNQSLSIPDDELKRELFSDIKAEVGYTVIHTPLTINAQRMMPCICKIAYETSHMVLGDLYLKDPLAEQYRAMLFSIAYDKKPDDVIEQATVEFDLSKLSKDNLFWFYRAGDNLMAQIVVLGFLKFSICITHDADRYISIYQTTSIIPL